MKKTTVEMMGKKTDGYALLRAGRVSGEVVRTYWTGSPWRALRDCVRGQ